MWVALVVVCVVWLAGVAGLFAYQWIHRHGHHTSHASTPLPGLLAPVHKVITHPVDLNQAPPQDVRAHRRVLLTAQADAVQNGIWEPRPRKWRRAADLCRDEQLVVGAAVAVENARVQLVLDVEYPRRLKAYHGVSFGLQWRSREELWAGIPGRVADTPQWLQRGADGTLSWHELPPWSVVEDQQFVVAPRELTWRTLTVPLGLSLLYVIGETQGWRVELWTERVKTSSEPAFRLQVLHERALKAGGQGEKNQKPLRFSLRPHGGEAWWTPVSDGRVGLSVTNDGDDERAVTVLLCGVPKKENA